MASVGEEELEYESDPEEAKISLTMRRREASDDEDEEEEERERRELPPRRIDSRVSDSESEGAAEEYDEEESEFEEEELEEDDELGKEQLYGKIGSDVKAMAVELDSGVSAVEILGTTKVVEEKGNRGVTDGGVYLQDGQFGNNVPDGIGQKEKKENEPFAVPTAGAFYMHDDRFRESAGGGRHRRNLGGSILWESKDDRKWGHDKFEEMSMQERRYGEGRKASRGRNRGRGKIRGQERGYPRENRPKTFNNNNRNNTPNNENNSAKNQNNAPKGVRGRGPRRYQSSWIEVSTRNKQHGKSVESDSYAISAKVSEPHSNVESGPIPAKKHVISSLNSVAPPFYPSASSTKEIITTHKINGQAALQYRNLPSSVADKSFSVSSYNIMRGKNEADSVSVNKLSIDDSPPTHTGDLLANSQLQGSGSSWSNPSLYPHSRVQGRGQTSMGKMTYQPIPPNNQVNRIANPSQFHNVHQAPVQTRHASLQASGQQLGQRTQALPDTAVTTTSLAFRESKSPPESNKSNTALIGKGKGVQGNGKGSVPYSGAQVIGASGNSGNSHDVNFPGMPTFLPVMQFGGQHSGGIGVPAVGMAFPGYVSNPGSGNSEMTWLPVLTGPAGALGATYSSPYLSVDGAYHARPSSQIPSLAGALSKENNISKPANDLNPSQKQEFLSDEFGQKQHKARRYTEMKFDQ